MAGVYFFRCILHIFAHFKNLAFPFCPANGHQTGVFFHGNMQHFPAENIHFTNGFYLNIAAVFLCDNDRVLAVDHVIVTVNINRADMG